MIKNLNAFDLKGKNILIRVDFNVPLEDGRVANTFRIKSALPTIKTCLELGGAVVLMSHLGRPNGKINSKLSLISVGEELAGLLEIPIKFSDNCISDDAIDTSLSLRPGEVHLLENLRFHTGEESNDLEFASKLARHGQIYINDAFGTAHRCHASNVGILDHFKHRGIGWLVEKEIKNFERVLKSPDRPLTLVLGGSKIKGKIGLIDHFLTKADNILIGGGMAFTFIKAQGGEIGDSLYEPSLIDNANSILEKANKLKTQIHLPIDVLAGNEFDNSSEEKVFNTSSIQTGWMGMDISTKTIGAFEHVIMSSNTIFWNGPMGVFEKEKFSTGTRRICEILKTAKEAGKYVIVGGGDSIAALKKFGNDNWVNYISTGGGAMLESLEGKQLPGVKALN